MTSPVIFPPGLITPLGDARSQSGVVPEVDFVGADGSIFYLQGGKSPDLSSDDGIGLLDMDPPQPPFDLLDEQGARQDGITNLDTVFGPAVIKLTLEASGRTPASLRRTVRTWISSWNPPNVGTLNVFTQELGEWWMPVRQFKKLTSNFKLEPSLHRRFPFTWECRGDNAFWQGVDSVSQFPGGAYPGAPQALTDGAATGFCPLTNLGTRPAPPRFLCYGPGTFTLGNGANVIARGQGPASGYAPGILSSASTPITFGPLKVGQVALVITDPRLRSVTDVNTPTNVLYPLLNGRFTSNAVLPGKQDGYPPVTSWIPVAISGGNADSKIVAACTPYRTWPW